ncbi:bis(5'-adenosyl)-triphosphatase-like, partial [Corticium candelabrum]|uniref:bis(5'-adenosyl)-triphosphatase-like n=1 Tax=Corticium candelabrum TaxID=121492 RepID=UPI002E27344B
LDLYTFGQVISMASLRFGQHLITSSQIFFQSSLSFAFVNIRPVVLGHVLVAPKRLVKRFAGLTQEEITDLFINSQRVCATVERAYNATSCTIAIQDGHDAGQTVEHVHVHIVPRRSGDFKRYDDVYDKINECESSLDSWQRTARSEQDMNEEASHLAAMLKQ